MVSEMEKLAKVPAVIQGMHEAGVDTFRGLKLLREAAESSEGDVFNRSFEYSEHYNTLKLCLIQECLVLRDPELTALMKTLNSNEGLAEDAIDDFLGSDLGDGWNLEMDATDYMSNTKGAEQESVKDAITSQIISPEEMADPLMKYNILQKMGMSDSVETFGSDDIKKAKWIIQLLEAQKFDKLQGVLKPFDNKSLQLRVLISWMKKPKFYGLDQKVQDMAEQYRQQLEQEIFQASQPAGPAAPGPQQPPPGSPPSPTA
jgi:hypothetical protein